MNSLAAQAGEGPKSNGMAGHAVKKKLDQDDALSGAFSWPAGGILLRGICIRNCGKDRRDIFSYMTRQNEK